MGTNCRRRGDAIHFRRRVPRDLKSQLKSSELILSLGRVTAGEARRISARLWLQSETLFVMLRANPNLDADAISKIVAATMRGFSEYASDVLADVGPLATESLLDEPINVAARMGGLATAAQLALDRCDLDTAIPQGTRLGQSLLGEETAFDIREGRRLARAVFQGIRGGAEAAEPVFARSGQSRKAPPISVEEFEASASDETIAALHELRVGDRIGTLLGALERIEAVTTKFVIDPVESQERASSGNQCARRNDGAAISHPALWAPSTSTRAWSLDKADWPLSKMWADFSEFQLENRKWGDDESKSSVGTQKMVIHILGDKPLSQYTASDMRGLRKVYRQLPSKYAQAQPWRNIYESQGPLAVIDAAAGKSLPRISDKTWNKFYSRVSPLFDYAVTQQGAALPPGTPNIMDGLFIAIKVDDRTPAQRRENWRLYTDDELVTLFTSPKFLGCTSFSRWDQAGPLAFRDARYWLTIIGFLHGNRREEPCILKVKHVKTCPISGVIYFNWRDPVLRAFLKDSGSPRDVPLHWKLLALGFMEARVHGRDPEARLFPEAESDAEIGGDAAPFGSWFTRLRKSCGLDGSKIDFHAARHTVITQLSGKNITEALIEAVVGHQSIGRRSSIESYKHPQRLMTLKSIVDQIDMPIDVDLLNAAVLRSDTLDRLAASPNLQAPRKWRRT